MGHSAKYLKTYREYLLLKNYSPETRKGYVRSIKGFFNYVSHSKNAYDSVQDYARSYLLSRIKGQLSWSSVNCDYSALVILFNHVLRMSWDYELTPRPKVAKKLPGILSIEQVTKLCNAVVNAKHQTIILLLYGTGLRISELLNLKIVDIDFDRLQLKVVQGKGNKDRMVNFSSLLGRVMKGYLSRCQPEVYLFNGVEKGGKYSKSSVRKIINRATEKAGIIKDVSPHTLRHCYATHHLDYGTDIVYLKRQLGHCNLNVTARYLHLCPHRASYINHPLDQLQIDYRMPLL